MFHPMGDSSSGIGNDRSVSKLIAQGDIKQIPYQSETDETKAGESNDDGVNLAKPPALAVPPAKYGIVKNNQRANCADDSDRL